ncbi:MULTISPECIES: hypothetical protein, partial [Methylococcus]
TKEERRSTLSHKLNFSASRVNDLSSSEPLIHTSVAQGRTYKGIEGLMDWYALHRRESPWERAAGVYARVLSKPQLFIEGNHRSGSLIMSYILAQGGAAAIRADRC